MASHRPNYLLRSVKKFSKKLKLFGKEFPLPKRKLELLLETMKK